VDTFRPHNANDYIRLGEMKRFWKAVLGGGRRFALAFFSVIDVYLWQRIRREAIKWRCQSAAIYRKQGSLIRLEQLHSYTDRYLRGNSQYYRFSVMAFMLLPILVLANSQHYLSVISTYLNFRFTAIPTDKWESFMPGLLILIYVMVGETWSWSYRLRAVHQIKFLDVLKGHYQLKPITQPP
jgi:hypothetical protein